MKMIDIGTTSIKLVDDCGDGWDCVLIFGSTPYQHTMIGGRWKRFVDARRVCQGFVRGFVKGYFKRRFEDINI